MLSRFDIENNVAMEESGGLHVESGVIYPHPDDPQKSRNTALRRRHDSTNRVSHRTDILQGRPEAAESGEMTPKSFHFSVHVFDSIEYLTVKIQVMSRKFETTRTTSLSLSLSSIHAWSLVPFRCMLSTLTKVKLGRFPRWALGPMVKALASQNLKLVQNFKKSEYFRKPLQAKTAEAMLQVKAKQGLPG